MLERVDLPFLGPVTRGKVRDLYTVGDHLVIVATDRISAFDRVLGTVPHKGQVLNQLAAWWFEQVADIVPTHLVAVPDPNVTVARRCATLPVEVVLRAYVTGVTSTSLWRRYELGEREMYGLTLPEGLHKNDPLPEPVVTPTTKAAPGAHDEPLSPAEVVARGLVDPELWARTLDAAQAVFRRGRELAAAAGLVLVDTKYEFGVDAEGRLTLIDEVHTPDSSRYWLRDPHRPDAGDPASADHNAGEPASADHNAGEPASADHNAGEPASADKELLRRWYADQGYRGEGEPPPFPDVVGRELSARYVEVYERLTGRTFEPAPEPAPERIDANLRAWLETRR